jgi:hypothetical protein
MECGMFSNNEDALKIPVNISIRDFKGCRTAMFGKTRLGKSNVVKLIAKGVMEATETDNSVGQIIFDINGEYANDNPQDGNKSLRSAFEDRCTVYALTPRAGTESKPLRFNFYEQPSSAIQVISSLLGAQPSLAQYIKNFMTVNLPTKEEFDDLAVNEKIRALWKVQIFWAILNKAGYKSDESSIRKLGWNVPKGASGFNPNFNQKLREAIYGNDPVPNPPSSLAELRKEMEMLQIFKKDNPQDSVLISKSSNSQYFDAEASALLEFLQPNSNSGGVRVIRPFIYYHDPEASDFASEIVSEIDSGNTVILDLGNATDEIRRYFSDYLSKKIFAHQETKFVSNNLGNHFVQLYFEEAHNLFPPNSNDLTGVYARFAKEGAKFHIGMVYSTQSPSTISRELLTQTENFFVGHLSSQEETKALSKLQTAFTGIEDDILRAKTPGYMRMLTLSHRFVIPVQTNKFEA